MSSSSSVGSIRNSLSDWDHIQEVSRKLVTDSTSLNHSVAHSISKQVNTLTQRVDELIKQHKLTISSNPFVHCKDRILDFLQITIFQSQEALERKKMRHAAYETQAQIKTVFQRIHPYKEDIKAQSKWLELGLPEQAISVAPNLVRNLYLSGQVFSMVGFQRGKEERSSVLEIENTLHILVRGKYIPFTDFEAVVRYDEVKQSLYTLTEEGTREYLSYIAPPKGFIELDPLKNHKLTAIDQLNSEELFQLKAHAARFNSSHPEDVKGILQICTRVGPSSGMVGMPQWLMKDNEENMPPHYFFRIIDNDGMVYPLGYTMKNFLNHKLMSAVQPGLIQHIDSCEFRKQDMIVTSVPLMSEEDLEKVKTASYKEHLLFQNLNKNCVTHIKHILHLIGIDVETRTSLEALVGRMIHNPIRALPVIGPVVRAFSTGISALQNAWTSYTPAPLQAIVTPLSQAVSFVGQRAFAVIKGLGLSFLGANRVHPQLQDDVNIEPSRPLLASWKDWFDPRATDVDNSVLLMDWQRDHPNVTERFQEGSRPCFHVLKAFEA